MILDYRDKKYDNFNKVTGNDHYKGD